MSKNRKIRRRQESLRRNLSSKSVDHLSGMIADKIVDGKISMDDVKTRISDKVEKLNSSAARELARNLYRKREELGLNISQKEQEKMALDSLIREAEEAESIPGTKELADVWFSKFGESEDFLGQLVSNVNGLEAKMKIAMLSMALKAGEKYSQAARFSPVVQAMLEDEIKIRMDEIKEKFSGLTEKEKEIAQTITEKVHEFMSLANGRPDFVNVVKRELDRSEKKENALMMLEMILNTRNRYESIEKHWWELLKVKRELAYEVHGHAITTMDGARDYVDEAFDNPELGMESKDKDSCFAKLYENFRIIRNGNFANRFPGEPELVAQRLFTAFLEKCEELPLDENSKLVWRSMCEYAIKWYKNEPGIREELSRLERVAIESITPPNSSANNLEIRYMSFARLAHSVDESQFLNGATFSYFTNEPKVQDILFEMGETSRTKDKSDEDEIFTFAKYWRESGFSRIEISHKLAAALSLTDTPVRVDSPWNHWSLIIPTDMLKFRVICGNEGKELRIKERKDEYSLYVDSKIERIWCEGCDPKYVMYRMNFVHTRNDNEIPMEEFPQGIIEGYSIEYVKQLQGKMVCLPAKFSSDINFSGIDEVVKNLVKGVCLCVTEKNQNRKGNWGSSSILKNGKKRKKGPPGAGERYVIGKTISIDLREELNNVLSGKTRIGASPKVQFLVRGHWRNQAFGKGRKSHKRIWIEPFWKGDEEARVLLRTYEVDNE